MTIQIPTLCVSHRNFFVAITFTLIGCGEPLDTPDIMRGESRAVIAGDRFRMGDESGEPVEVRLAEIRAARDGETGAKARRRLAALLEEAGPRLEIASTGAAADRYGRRVGHAEFIRAGERIWIQRVLVSEGLAVVNSYADNRARAAELLAVEADARRAGHGGWGEGVFVIRGPDPNRLAQHLESFQIVEGRVIDTGSARSGRVYLNFGLEWRTDFTVSIRAEDLEGFREAGLDPERLAGARVRVRGWVYRENGPMIAIDHPEALEILDAPAPASSFNRPE